MTFSDELTEGGGTKRPVLEAPLYSAGIGLYRLGVRLAGVRNPKARKLDKGQSQIWQILKEKLHPGDRVIWVHAASLGEFEQGRPLIEKIKASRPEYKILLTFFSPSGYEVRKDYTGADCVTYLPFDTPRRVRRFLDTVKPEMAIFVKYEIWRNYLYELDARNIPTYLISAVFRPDQFFFRYPESWYGQWLNWYKRIFVQDERSRRLLESIQIRNVDVCGDTRFDRVSQIRANVRRIPELEAFTHRGSNRDEKTSDCLVIMAGSSWPADEDIYSDWINRHPEVRLVIAPHEFDDERLKQLKQRFTNGAVLLSEVRENAQVSEEKQVLIIDCFGLLSSAYSYCDIAYVGGGFGDGLHNINEAAVYGIPVIYGPNNHKFIEAREMAECTGGLPVDSRETFEKAVNELVSDPDERKRRGEASDRYIRSKIGATDKIFKSIFDQLQE